MIRRKFHNKIGKPVLNLLKQGISPEKLSLSIAFGAVIGILPVLAGTYGTQKADPWFQRWRVFFMACSELLGYTDGRPWVVAHCWLKKKSHVQGVSL